MLIETSMLIPSNIRPLFKTAELFLAACRMLNHSRPNKRLERNWLATANRCASTLALPGTATHMTKAVYALFAGAILVNPKDASLSQQFMELVAQQEKCMALIHPTSLMEFRLNMYFAGQSFSFLRSQDVLADEILNGAQQVANKDPQAALNTMIGLGMRSRWTYPETSASAFRAALSFVERVGLSGNRSLATLALQKIANFANEEETFQTAARKICSLRELPWEAPWPRSETLPRPGLG